MTNRVIIRNAQGKAKIPTGTRMLIRRCCNAVLTHEQFPTSIEVGVTIVDNEEIRRLNREFRSQDSVTDVLSFPQYNNMEEAAAAGAKGSVMLGDVVLSLEMAYTQAETYNHSLQREIGFLVVHSMLHLLGFDHEEGGLQEVHIREKEESVLRQLGLARGYNYVLGEGSE